MKECESEADVLAAAMAGPLNTHWTEHVRGCALCAEVVSVAAAVRQSEPTVPALPSAEAIWWRAQLRARREAVKAAERPITAAHAIAFGAAMGLFGACFGAMSSGVQLAVAQTIALLRQAFAGAGVYAPLLAAGAGAMILAVPLAIWFTLSRD